MIFNSPERVAALSPHNPYDRLPDGRPNVPDDILQRMKLVTNDEAWGVIERGHGYHFQFEGNWMNLHPDRVLVGRAVTARIVPLATELQEIMQESGPAKDAAADRTLDHRRLFARRRAASSTSSARSKMGPLSATTWGQLLTRGRARDWSWTAASGIWSCVLQLPDFNVFCHGAHPSAIYEVTLAEVNGPIRIGNATVLPRRCRPRGRGRA